MEAWWLRQRGNRSEAGSKPTIAGGEGCTAARFRGRLRAIALPKNMAGDQRSSKRWRAFCGRLRRLFSSFGLYQKPSYPFKVARKILNIFNEILHRNSI